MVDTIFLFAIVSLIKDTNIRIHWVQQGKIQIYKRLFTQIVPIFSIVLMFTSGIFQNYAYYL